MTGLLAISLFALAGPAAAKDRNHDRIPDRWEKRYHLSLHKNQAKLDQDHDGLANRREFRASTSPRDPDSDNDGIEDGDEGDVDDGPTDDVDDGPTDDVDDGPTDDVDDGPVDDVDDGPVDDVDDGPVDDVDDGDLEE
jgi:hypothetical protein